MKYTVRVELHGAGDNDYEELHDAMEKLGFMRWIRDEDGTRYHLPAAEYNIAGSHLNCAAILERAKAAAKSVKPYPKPWILASASVRRTWSGLEPVESLPPY